VRLFPTSLGVCSRNQLRVHQLLKISLRNNQLDTTTVNQPACRWALYESADSRTILEYGHALHELDSNKNITDSNNHIERIASSRYISDGLWTPDSGVFEKSHSSTYWQRLLLCPSSRRNFDKPGFVVVSTTQRSGYGLHVILSSGMGKYQTHLELPSTVLE
jgi:hypothetical protein